MLPYSQFILQTKYFAIWQFSPILQINCLQLFTWQHHCACAEPCFVQKIKFYAYFIFTIFTITANLQNLVLRKYFWLHSSGIVNSLELSHCLSRFKCLQNVLWHYKAVTSETWQQGLVEVNPKVVSPRFICNLNKMNWLERDEL